MMPRFLLLNLIGVALVAVAALAGIAMIPFDGDSTYMTHGIAAVFLIGLVQAARGRWASVEWISDKLVWLGLLGTVLGFIIALAGIDAGAASDAASVQPMVAQLIAGMGTALYTTLVGSIGAMWLDLNLRLLHADQ